VVVLQPLETASPVLGNCVTPSLQVVNIAFAQVTATATAKSTPPLSLEQTDYQLKAKKLVTLVNDLRDVGAQFQFDLPCLVVCGNQSAGKSSLLERICGVKLPRAAGTCTKCPTEVCTGHWQPNPKSDRGFRSLAEAA